MLICEGPSIQFPEKRCMPPYTNMHIVNNDNLLAMIDGL